MGELNASYLQPQIKDINSVINYRSQLYKRYLKNFLPWSKDYFSICNKTLAACSPPITAILALGQAKINLGSNAFPHMA